MANQPDFDLAYLNKTTNEKGRIGAAWRNENGTISIVLNKLIVLRESKDVVLTLFPKDYKASNLAGRKVTYSNVNPTEEPSAKDVPPPEDDDVPF